MVIGRTDERQNPFESMAVPCRKICLDAARGTHLGQRSCDRVKGRTHDRIRTNTKCCKTNLNPTGRPHMIQALCCIGGQRGKGWVYSNDLREPVAAAVLSGRSCREVAVPFSASIASAVKWSQRVRQTGSAAAKPLGRQKTRFLAPKSGLDSWPA